MTQEEEIKEKNKLEYKRLISEGIIKYDHPFRQKWDILIVIISLYNCIELPLDIAFKKEKNVPIYVLNVLSEIFFVADLILNFRTTTIDCMT